MNRPPVLSVRRGQNGVGLVELLISVLVLSVGLLGVAWVQTKALSTNSGAASRSMAVVASYNIMDAMRADLTLARSGTYNSTVAANDCPSAGTLAQSQIREWCGLLGDMLGASSTTTGTINCVAGPGASSCTITIQYDEGRIGEGAGIETVVTKGMI